MANILTLPRRTSLAALRSAEQNFLLTCIIIVTGERHVHIDVNIVKELGQVVDLVSFKTRFTRLQWHAMGIWHCFEISNFHCHVYFGILPSMLPITTTSTSADAGHSDAQESQKVKISSLFNRPYLCAGSVK